jgi:hypothetical protein
MESKDGWSGVQIPAEAGNFPLHYRVQTDSGAYPASYPMVPGARPLGAKRPGREDDHSPPSSAEVENACSYTSTTQYVIMAWCSVKKKKHRDNFTLLPFTRDSSLLTSRGLLGCDAV